MPYQQDLYLSLFPNLEQVIDYFPVTTKPETPLFEVFNLMSQRKNNLSKPPKFEQGGKDISSISELFRNSYILVTEGKKLVGILTERDLVKLTAKGQDFSLGTVAEVMITDLITLNQSQLQDFSLVLSIMRQNRIRHLPVINQEQHLVGIITTEKIRHILQPANLLRLRLIEDVMVTEIVQASRTASVLQVAQLMAEHQVSCVVITENKISENLVTEHPISQTSILIVPVGIITERDIVQFKQLEIDLVDTQAQKLMSNPLFCLTANDSLWYAQQVMEKRYVRHLVIVGEQGELKGILTQSSMLKVLDFREIYGIIGTLEKAVEGQTQQLQEEVNRRKEVEKALQRNNQELEKRVQERTVFLERTNAQLLSEIAERKKIERELFREKELAQVTLKSIGDGVITTDLQGCIEYFNPVAEKLLGWTLTEAKGKPLTEIFKIINETSRQPSKNPVIKVLQKGCTVKLSNHHLLIAKDGTEFAIEDSAAPIRDRQGEIIGTVLIFHDVSKSKQLAEKLNWQGSHDALTGLHNRHVFEQLLESAIINAQEENQHHVFCYLDLDQFKVVNDTCGHVAGDELLRQLSTLLTKRVRETDLLARLGGDEFGILLYQCSLSNAESIANSYRQLIKNFRFVWQERNITIGASLGLVAINKDSTSLKDVLSAADAACYAAKDRGRNRIHVYQVDDQTLVQQRNERQWVSKINQALEEDRFYLYYQGIFPTHEAVFSAIPQHYEILIRLREQEGQVVPPMAFIPAAERYNLMPTIDRWVIRRFCADYDKFKLQNPQSPYSPSHYTINLSGASLSDEKFLDFIKEQLILHHVDPQVICFEVTETAAISNLSQAAYFIQELKNLGCYFALDDFGSGMSSFAYLKNLPVDYLKIDGNFVRNLDKDKIDQAMVECINHLGHAMGIQTIAEFVENEAIFAEVKSLGIDYAQGYGLARPVPWQTTSVADSPGKPVEVV